MAGHGSGIPTDRKVEASIISSDIIKRRSVIFIKHDELDNGWISRCI